MIEEISEELIRNLDILISNYEENKNSYKEHGFNEQATRQEYIDQFLLLLGWDVRNLNGNKFSEREVLVEEYSSKEDRPDYTIKYEGKSLFFIEAKNINVNLLSNRDNSKQIRRYGWNAGHKIAVLTNFTELIIYQTYKAPEDEDSSTSYRYKHYHYTEYKEKFKEIYSLLSRESVARGYFKTWTSSITPESAMKNSLDEVFLSQINEWRIDIAKDLVKSGKQIYLEIDNLNEIVQNTLNQLVFLRFAEDNGIEESYTLKSFVDYKINHFKLLSVLDKKYNAGLFIDNYISDITYETLNKIIKNLYLPTSYYDFSMIDLSILSKMYENYLQHEISLNGDDVILRETEDKKVKSVVSTPIEIVKYMVKLSLQEKLNGKSVEEILELKICDLSVGSGTFLLEAYNYIESFLIDIFTKNTDEKPSSLLIPFSVKLQIVTNVLYGFDINKLAVQLTKFSLMLRILQEEERQKFEEYPILKDIKNIIHGNALIDETQIPLDLSLDNWKDIVPNRMNLTNDEKFDVIIGNPPYLKIEDMRSSTKTVELNLYKKYYTSALRQYDKYYLFIERAISLLKDDSTSVMIVLNKFFTNVAGKNLRKFIKEEKVLSTIINFKSSQLFKGYSTYVSILKLEKNQEAFNYIESDNIESIKNNITLEYKTNLLTDAGWFLTSNMKMRNQYEKAIRLMPRVTEEIQPINGIQTSKDKVYKIFEKEIIKKDENYLYFQKNDIQFKIELGILRRHFKNNKKTMKSYDLIETDSYVIFPYKDGSTYNIDEMTENFPETMKYFNYFKNDLLPREQGGTRDVKAGDTNIWYRYGRNQSLKEIDEEKIIVGVLSKFPNFNVDKENMLFSSGGTAGYIALKLKENSKYSLEYIQAWLSHNFIDNIFKVIGSDFEGEYYTHGTYLYEAVPMLSIDFEDENEADDYEYICNNVKSINAINISIKKEVNKTIIRILNRKKMKLISEINNKFDELLEKKLGD